MDERSKPIAPVLHRWPGGTLDTVRPIDLAQSKALVDVLGPLPPANSADAAIIVQEHMGQALLRMLHVVETQLKQKSHVEVENAANELLRLHKPLLGSSGHMAAAALAKNLGKTYDEFQKAVAKTGRELVNSGSDGRRHDLLNAFCSHVVACADELLERWTLPAKVSILDRTEKAGPGVLTFAENALPILCGHLREEIPNAADVILELEKTSRNSLCEALRKLRRLTTEQALQTMQANIFKRSGKAKRTPISVKTRK